MEKQDRFSRQADIVNSEKLSMLNAYVIGVGAIGRQVALQLTAIGAPSITLIDPDIVEDTNVVTQGYFEEDAESAVLKVVATSRMCRLISKDVRIDLVHHNAPCPMRVLDPAVVFCCVDSMKARAEIFKDVSSWKPKPLFIDGRMTAEVCRVLVANPTIENSWNGYTRTLFSDAASYAAPCTAKATIYCANIAAGFMLSQFTKHLRGFTPDGDTLINILAGDMNTIHNIGDREKCTKHTKTGT